MNLIADICTLSNNKSYCLSGITAVIGIAVSTFVMLYIFFWIVPVDIKEICDALKTYVETIGGIGVGCSGGKIATNYAGD